MQALMYCFVLIGISDDNYPSDSEIPVVVASLRRAHLNYTLEDVKLAFQMFIDGKLNITSEKHKHFHRFDSDYMNTVLRHYKWKKQSALSKQTEQTRKIEMTTNKPIRLTDKGYYEIIQQYCDLHKELPENEVSNWLQAYDHADATGILGVSTIEKHIIVEKVKADLESQIEEAHQAKNYPKEKYLTMILESKTLFKFECQERTIKNHFTRSL